MTFSPAETSLTPEELSRYARHLNLAEVGVDGQRKLKASRVLLVGTGGLGSPLALYLAAAGVGTLGIVDFDEVDQSNLQRQILHGTKDVGRTKVDSARDRLSDINPHVRLELHPTRLCSENALSLLESYDVVVDGTDNFPTRYLINDACVLLKKPNVYGSIFRFEGQVSVFDPAQGSPCYRCLYPEPPPPGTVPSCAEGGVLGVLPGVVGSLQATEVLKLILGVGKSLRSRLLLFDALGMRFREMQLAPNPDCSLCGCNPSLIRLIDYDVFCGVAEGSNTAAADQISPREFVEGWKGGQRPRLLDVREPYEWDIANLSEYEAVLIPLAQLSSRLDELDREDDIVVYCKSGGRSAQAVTLLREAGFRRIRDLTGGVLAWREDVDPSKPKY